MLVKTRMGLILVLREGAVWWQCNGKRQNGRKQHKKENKKFQKRRYITSIQETTDIIYAIVFTKMSSHKILHYFLRKPC